MKYTPEITDKISKDYQAGKSVKDIAAEFDVPERSIIAKLSSLGIYQKKQYLNKRGEVPVSKQVYIDRIAKLLDINAELLESMEKVTKNALILLDQRVQVLIDLRKHTSTNT